MAGRLQFPRYRAPARFGVPSFYHFGIPAGLPFYRFRHSGLPSGLAIYHLPFNATVGFPIIHPRTCRFTIFTILAHLQIYQIIILPFYRNFRFSFLPFPNLSPYPSWKSTILPFWRTFRFPFSIFAYLARMPVYHMAICANLVRLPNLPFTNLAPYRIGSLSFYDFSLDSGIHISIFPDLAYPGAYRFTILQI